MKRHWTIATVLVGIAALAGCQTAAEHKAQVQDSSTDRVYSTSSGGLSALILGFGGSVAGGVGASGSSSTGAASTSQRALTVIIKFDNEKKVRDFAYHQSQF